MFSLELLSLFSFRSNRRTGLSISDLGEAEKERLFRLDNRFVVMEGVNHTAADCPVADSIVGWGLGTESTLFRLVATNRLVALIPRLRGYIPGELMP